MIQIKFYDALGYGAQSFSDSYTFFSATEDASYVTAFSTFSYDNFLFQGIDGVTSAEFFYQYGGSWVTTDDFYYYNENQLAAQIIDAAVNTPRTDVISSGLVEFFLGADNVIEGNSFSDYLNGYSGNDYLYGNGGNDQLVGGAGNDYIDGGGGVDRAIYMSARANYTITETAYGYQVVALSGPEGADTLINIDRILFSDQTLSVGENNAPDLTTPSSIVFSDSAENTTYATAQGSLVAIDSDGDAVTYSIAGGQVADGNAVIAGKFGSLILNTHTGNYSFTPNAREIETQKSSVSETFTVSASDGRATSEKVLTITVHGADDPTAFTGRSTGIVHEDRVLEASGAISASDRDSGDDALVAQMGSEGSYGTFAIDSGGVWRYSLRNSDSHIQSLQTGETLTDSFTVSAVSGAEHVINITIGGASEPLLLLPTKVGGTVFAGTDADELVEAGATNDKIVAGNGNNVISAGEGNNNISAGIGHDVISSGAGNDKIVAGDGDNVINAGGGNNNISSGSGDDLIGAGSGNDKISAGGGGNSIDAGHGNNNVSAGDGDDQILTGDGNDKVNAGSGNNTIDAGNGANKVTAGSGADMIATHSGKDNINAGEGNNYVSSGAEADSVTTGSGYDQIFGGAGNDKISAGAGSDRIDGGAGADKLAGGAGIDTFVFSAINSGEFDTITDFDDDVLEFDLSVFTGLAGASEESFVLGAAALDANDYLVYNASKGVLYYDADGSGAGAAVQIALIKGADAKSVAFEDFQFS